MFATALHASSLLAKDIEVQAAGCDDLNVKEIARLVEIELSGSVKGGMENHDLVVQLTCNADIVTVVTSNNTTKRSVQREIVRRQSNVQERVVALSISQLILSSLEELKTFDESHVADKENPEPTASQVQRDGPLESPEHKPARLLGGYDLLLTGGGKFRLSSPVVVGAIGLRGNLLFASKFGIALIGEFETGSIARKLGEVKTMAGFGGLSGFGRFVPRGSFYLDTGLSALVGYGYLKARSSGFASGRSASGMTGEFALFIAPTLKLRRVLLCLALKGGYTLENPVGLIPNEKSVTLGGFWIGADLGIGLRVGTVH
jgi:hypothetical protein